MRAHTGDTKLLKVRADRNGRIIVLSNQGLLQVEGGTLKPDHQYRPLPDMQIKDIEVFRDKFVYLTDRYVLSNAWAGQLLVEHHVRGAHKLAMRNLSSFVVVGEDEAVRFEGNKAVAWHGVGDRPKQAAFDPRPQQYLLLDACAYRWLGDLEPHIEHTPLNCFAFSNDGRTLLIGTSDGYFGLDPNSAQGGG